jgi:ADP-ribosyl-[dinitrogen reductase] hydrolase
MAKSHWNYRIVREVRPSPNCPPHVIYHVLEVYYDEDETIRGWSYNHDPLTGLSSLSSLDWTLRSIQAAMAKPLLYLLKDENGKQRALVHEPEYVGLLDLRDRLKGCLLGCAVGDAYGVPYERKSASEMPEVVVTEFPQPAQSWSSLHAWRGVKGQYSDDTQLSRLVLESFLEGDGKVDVKYYVEALQRLHVSDNPVGFGKGTSEAIHRLLEGTPWTESGSLSEGNGAAMKAPLLGMLCETKDNLYSWVQDLSLPTHRAPLAVDSAYVVACLSYYLKTEENETLSPCLLRQVCVDLYEVNPDSPLSADLRHLRTLLTEGYGDGEILQWVLSLEPRENPSGGRDWDGISPYCRTTILWAIASFFLGSHSFRDVLDLSLKPGGDVDTIAAISCALYGILNGYGSLPSKLVDAVHDSGEWTGKDLLALCSEAANLIFRDRLGNTSQIRYKEESVP